MENEALYIVTSVWSNEDDWTGCEPKVFSSFDLARKYFDSQLKQALDDFVNYDYVSQAWADFFYWFVKDNSLESLIWNMAYVEDWKSLQYEIDEFGIEFWNDTELNDYDFGYSINIHKALLD